MKLAEVLAEAREDFAKSLMEVGLLLEEKDDESGPEEAFKRFQKAAEIISQLQVC